MKLPFTKMHGCGNDYIYVDCFHHPVENPEALAVVLSHRRFSIGGDGMILICPSDKADARMRMFNNDGSEGKMCGNGIRCVAKFCYDKGICKKNPLRIETLSGIKEISLKIGEDGLVQSAVVDMGAPILKPSEIPVCLDGEQVLQMPLEVEGVNYSITCVSMGNPHCVLFVDRDFDLWGFDLEKIGPKFENHPLFPQRTNTEFVKVLSPTELEMRVWERGSGETWACGTGTCATVVASCLCQKSPMNTPITVHLKGGDLVIRYTKETVFMEGPAVTAFEGIVEI
jgi:diaminopimelate epimerase